MNLSIIPAEEWRFKLQMVFEAERKMWSDCAFEHNHEIILLKLGELPHIMFFDNHICNKYHKKLLTEKAIKDVYYLNVKGIEEKSFEEKYFLCIGKTNDKYYFTYTAKACGTGFGFAETSKLYLCEDYEALLNRSLTEMERIQYNSSVKYLDCSND